MTNIKASIFAAFERMWFHMTDALNKKADKTHEHDNIYNKAEVDVLLSNKSDAEHTHEVADIIDLSSQLNTKVPATRKINDKALNVDITLNAADVGADASGSAANALNESKAYTDTEVAKKATPAQIDSKIAEHNVDTAAHNDIRISLSELATKVNNFLDVDDATTDQLSELLTLISENADDIEAITNGKVNISDIIDNLTTNTSDKPLSAAQGVAIKALIDELQAELDSHTHEISDVTNLQSTLDGKASKSVATISSDGLMSADDKIQLDNGGHPIVTTSGDGAAYTATIDGITALTNGMKITIIPHTVSTTTTPTLNVNGLGAKSIRMPVAYNTGASTGGTIAPWLSKSKPVTLQYNGTYWLTSDMPRASALYLQGVVPVANGGTGATTAEDALTNLGAASASDLSALETEVNNIASTYLPLSGGTMTGTLRVNNAPIFGYRYGQSNDAPAFVFDKPGSNYTGIGANGEADTIYFGAADGTDWTWNKDYKQKWKFNGSIIADTLQLSNSSYGTSLPTAGTPGRIFFKKV